VDLDTLLGRRPVLALPLVALAAAIGLDRPGPKGERVRLFHGTRDLAGVVLSGKVNPSSQDEIVRDVWDCIDLYKRLQERAWFRIREEGKEDEPEEYVEQATETWDEQCLVPMRGFAYVSTDLAVARFYARQIHGLPKEEWSKVGGVVEVAPTSGIVIPDEDWIGTLCVKYKPIREFLDIVGDGDKLGVRGDPEAFTGWADGLQGLLGRSFLNRLSSAHETIADELSFGGFDSSSLRASLGKTIIREAMRTPTGQRWLVDGLQFATEVAHHGPLEVVGIVESDAVHPSPVTDQYGDVWVVDGKVSA
jgi:hypothetical protein